MTKDWKCPFCGTAYLTESLAANCINSHKVEFRNPLEGEYLEANRVGVEYRFDLLIPEFLEELAKLAAIGARKYGDRNWQQSRLTGDKSPLNHGIDHILRYQKGQVSDVLEGKEGQLVSCAFNCMMEWWYERNLK